MLQSCNSMSSSTGLHPPPVLLIDYPPIYYSLSTHVIYEILFIIVFLIAGSQLFQSYINVYFHAISTLYICSIVFDDGIIVDVRGINFEQKTDPIFNNTHFISETEKET